MAASDKLPSQPSENNAVENTNPQLKAGPSNLNMKAPVYMQTSGNRNVVLVPRFKRKQEGTWRQLSRWFIDNQIGTLRSAPPSGRIGPARRMRTPPIGILSTLSPTLHVSHRVVVVARYGLEQEKKTMGWLIGDPRWH